MVTDLVPGANLQILDLGFWTSDSDPPFCNVRSFSHTREGEARWRWSGFNRIPNPQSPIPRACRSRGGCSLEHPGTGDGPQRPAFYQC